MLKLWKQNAINCGQKKENEQKVPSEGFVAAESCVL